MIKCVIVDDEPIARRGMKRMVERDSRLELLASLGSAEEALAYLEGNDVDLLFLDIRMPGISGMDLARRLPEPTMVIFTTAYPDYALESYSVDAVGYLVKPIDPELFRRAVDKAVEYTGLIARATAEAEPAASSSSCMIVKADRRYHRIPYDRIDYVEGLKDYVILHLDDGTRLVTRSTIKSMEEMLPVPTFIRVSKSYIVRMAKVDSFDTNDLFIGTAQIPIGAAYRQRVTDVLME